MTSTYATDDVDEPATALVEFVLDLEYADCPPAAVEMARKCIVDTVGVTVAGTGEAVSEKVRDYVGTVAADGESTVVGGGDTYPAEYAALVNGVQGHALDYDDVSYYTFPLHPSVTLVPTLLALGETTDASGEDLVSGFVAGFETEIRITGGVGGRLTEDGYHPTAVVGPFGAAAAAARLLDLTPGQTRHAFAIVASLYSGLTDNFGTMTKPLHAGMPNQKGIRAARLAKAGFTANDSLLSTESGPWPYPYDEFDLAAWTGDLGDRWYTGEGIGIKLYPACGCTHGGVDAARELHAAVEDADDIDSVLVRSTPAGFTQLKYDDPSTPLEGKFSMEYCVAAALVDGNVNLTHFTAESVQRRDLQALVDRTTHEPDESLEGDSYVSDGFPARVEVTLRDGRTLTEEVQEPTGTADVQISDAELEEKFHNCMAEGGVDPDHGTELYDALRNVDDVDDVRDVTALL